jgi:hypothetical protein
MQAPDFDMDPSAQDEPRELVKAWIESADGSISRGLVEDMTERGAVIRLASAAAWLDVAAEVAVRLSFDPTAPNVEVRARVVRTMPEDDASLCEVAWLPEAGPVERVVSASGALRPAPGNRASSPSRTGAGSGR